MLEADAEVWQFLLNRRGSVGVYETLSLSHPNFSRTFHLLHRWRKAPPLTLEDGQTTDFMFVPMRLVPMGASGDLDYGVQVTLGDLGQIIPDEIDRVKALGGMATRPQVVFRTWRTDDTLAPLSVIGSLEAVEISRNEQGASFQAVAPRLNLVRTGETYNVERFDMLRGFLQ